MVAVHDISLDRFEDGVAAGAVAISLLAPSQRDRVHRFSREGWEVELKRGRDHVVARTNQLLAGDALIDAAIDIAHRALDLSSVEDGDHLVTKAPADDHIVLELVGGQRIVRFQGVSDLTIGMEATLTVTRGDGTIEPQPERPVLPWTPAFRFHRLSQGSRDLFDAYRNMFLGLEALLDQLFAKRRGEGEKAWLLRSIRAVGARVDLASLATPGAADPARDLVDRLYGVRLHLFHAKTGRLLIPDERVSYTAVAAAYPTLLALWTEVARQWLSLRRGGGVVTYQGFRMMVEATYVSVKIGVTADSTPANKEDTAPSPLGFPVFLFEEHSQVLEIRPGRMGLIGRTAVSALPAGQVVGRVVVVLEDGTLLMIGSITGGLTLAGADVFVTTYVIRLINRGQPRTEFS